ncbi:MAG: TRAP transporter fused permease subunit, partial [Alphaproteobacteria bacterium]|nr:TRAP transporter fused permease subunit [Alphaproteobacteria bacterium]
ADRSELESLAHNVVFTGKVDEYFDYCEGEDAGDMLYRLAPYVNDSITASLIWYTTPNITGATPLATAPSISTVLPGAGPVVYEYWLTRKNWVCESQPAQLQIGVNPKPSNVIFQDDSITLCNQPNYQLATNQVYSPLVLSWYDKQPFGPGDTTGGFVLNGLAPTEEWYYATKVDALSGCESDFDSIKVKITVNQETPRALFGVALLTQEFTLCILGLCLAISFFKTDDLPYRVRPISVTVGIICIGTFLFAAMRYRILSEEMFYHPKESFALGLLMVPVVLLALYRQVGMMLFAIVIAFITYGLFGDLLPQPFTARPWVLMDLMPHLALDTTSMVGVPLTIGVTVVIPFIIFGSVLFANGGGQFFTDLAISMMGGFRGGAAKIAVISSALFGMISGSAVSNVASTGVISIPMMKHAGLKGRIAAATEAVASTGGQFMPPVMGAAAFLMSELSRVPYPTIAVAAILPAFFFFLAVFMQSDADAIRYNVKAVPEEERLPANQIIKDGWHFIIPFVVLIGLMFGLNQSPQLAALSASLTTIVLGFWRGYSDKPLRLGRLITAFQKAGETSIEIIIIVAAAGFVIGVLNATGLVFNLTLIIVDLAGGQLVALLILAALISIILGMGMPTMAVYVLLAALVVPS